MLRAAIVVAMLVVLPGVAFAQIAPSVFTSSSADFSQVQRVALFPFQADPSSTQDPYAATKATELLGAALAARGIVLVNMGGVFNRMQGDTGHTFANPATPEDTRLYISLLPKYLDAVILGHVSAWGLISVQQPQVVPVRTYGWGSGAGTATVMGPGGFATITGSGSASWHATSYVPIQVTREASMIGASVALVQLQQDGSTTLLWEYSNVTVDQGTGAVHCGLLGCFQLRRPSPPDQLAQNFFGDVAKAFPVR